VSVVSRSRLGRTLAPAVALLAFVSVAAANREPRDAPPIATARASAAAGSLSIANSLGTGAILSAAGMAPGGQTSGEVTITNSGTVAGGFSLTATDVSDVAGQGGGLLSQRLQLSVLDLTVPRTVYTGPLAGLGRRELGQMEPGEARTYRFTATLPDGGVPPSALGGDNAYQGANVRTTYVWTASAPDSPTGGGAGGGGAGGGTGGGGAGGGGAGTGPGTTQLTLRVALVPRQPGLKRRQLVFYATCNDACSLTARAKLARRGGRLRGRKVNATANQRVKLKLRLSRKSARKLARALRRKRGTQLSLTVVASDAASRTVTFKRKVALKQVRRGGRKVVRASWQKTKKRKRSRSGR
jgi:hypothetical protein